MPPADIAVVCVTHRSGDLLPEYATALGPALRASGARVVVIDVASPDDTLQRAHDLLPEADVLVLSENRGFAAGVNAGIAHVRDTGGALAFAIVNPDVRLERDTLPRLFTAFVETGAFVCVPRLTDGQGRLQLSLRRAPSLAATFAESFLGGPLAARLRLPTEVIRDEDVYSDDHDDAVWATGGMLMISDECLRTVGALDESFFMYEEEVEFCTRVASYGGLLHYCAGARAVRLVDGPREAPWREALMKTNRVRLLGRRGRAVRASARLGLFVWGLLRAAAGRPEGRAVVWALARMARPEEIMDRYAPAIEPVVARPGDPASRAVLVWSGA